MSTEVRLDNVSRYPSYGLRRSGYYASVSDGGLARIVALACEGVVWGRLWGVEVSPDGVMAESGFSVSPPFAWLGDHYYGDHHTMRDQALRQGMN